MLVHQVPCHPRKISFSVIEIINKPPPQVEVSWDTHEWGSAKNYLLIPFPFQPANGFLDIGEEQYKSLLFCGSCCHPERQQSTEEPILESKYSLGCQPKIS